MCDRCHDIAHSGLWDLGPLALGSLALGLLACLWLQVPVHHACQMFVGE